MTVTTYQIAGRSPFPIITDFLAYAIERQTMKDPMPVNLRTSEEVRARGHQAECRDSDGHLTRTHTPFKTDNDVLWLVGKALEAGDSVTIWPLNVDRLRYRTITHFDLRSDADVIARVGAAMNAGEALTILPLRGAGEVRHG